MTGEILPGSMIIQSFTPVHSYLRLIGINFATYKRKNTSSLILELLDEEGNVLVSENLHASKIRDNDYYFFMIEKILNKNQKYFLKIYTNNGVKGNAVTLRWGYRKHVDEFLYINNQIKRGELCCYCLYDDGNNDKIIVSSENVEGMVSFVIPTYNTSKYLTPLLQSIEQQTYNFYEVIVVDDFSIDVDKVKSIVTEYQKKMDIKLFCRDQNGGAPKARNEGAFHAKGEFLLFTDSDIVWRNDALMKMVQILHINLYTSWVYCNFMIGTKPMMFRPFDLQIMKKRNLCSTMSMMRKKDFLGFNENLERLQDWDLFLRMGKMGLNGKWIDAILFDAADRNGISNGGISYEMAVQRLKKYHPDLNC